MYPVTGMNGHSYGYAARWQYAIMILQDTRGMHHLTVVHHVLSYVKLLGNCRFGVCKGSNNRMSSCIVHAHFGCVIIYAVKLS